MNYKKGFDPEYDDTKENNVIYFHKKKIKENGLAFRKVELLIPEDKSYLSEKNAPPNSIPIDVTITEKTTLYESSGGQQKIQCWLCKQGTDKYFRTLHISRRTGNGVYGSQEISLTLDGVIALKKFLEHLSSFDYDKYNGLVKININDETTPVNNCNHIISEREFMDLIKTNIKSTDDFYKLISIQKMDLAINTLENIINGNYKNEVEIQHFLKENLWMFGNDYSYIIENSVVNAQNILDMIPQNFESYIDIIEVKLPKEKLFNFDNDHNNYYSTSHLTKAIAQTQNYIFELEKKTSDELYQNKNNCKVIKPKGTILFGSHPQLNEHEQQYLRILNSSYHNLKIITYQQLLEKAKNTLQIWKNNSEKP